MNSFAVSCYGIVLSIMQLDFVCNDKVFIQVGQLLPFPPILTIHQHQLRFLGHILGKPEKKPINPTTYQPFQINGIVGHPKTMFVHYVGS